MVKPPLPVMVAPPTCCACTTMGALAVPDLERLMSLLVEYEPSASWMTSPGDAVDSALRRAGIELTTCVAEGVMAATLGRASATGMAATATAAVPRTNQRPRLDS